MEHGPGSININVFFILDANCQAIPPLLVFNKCQGDAKKTLLLTFTVTCCYISPKRPVCLPKIVNKIKYEPFPK